MPLPADTRLGPYSIVTCIGSGGMGDVYRAWDSRLERHIAIKLLTQELASDERARSRFRREARAIAALAHPNILSIYDAELEYPPFYLVTELLEGETLRSATMRSLLPAERSMAIIAAVGEGLAAAHDAGIIHRDIKPENVFLTIAGAIRILDFGLAHLNLAHDPGDGTLASTMSDANIVLGTVGYMAPEQALGKDISPATDVFALGCVAYEMLTGHRAFQRATPASTLLAILNEQTSWPGDCLDHTPADMVRWVNRCLDKDPRRRPQSAREAVVAFKACSGERGTFAFPDSSKEDIRRLAVLPFVASSTSPDAEFLADGITESLINNLAQLRHLKVVARSTVYRHKGKDVDPIQVGRDLNVEAILTGKVFQRGEILLIGAELANVRDGSQLWGQQYKRQLTDIFAIEEELSREIAGRLRTQLTTREAGQIVRRYTESPEAYQLYLRGRHAWNKRTLDGMRQSVRYFDQAIELDPAYARAYTGLADAIQMLGVYGDLESRQARNRARAAQDRALEIDNSAGEALASAGFRMLFFDWNYQGAEQILRRAVELNPSYASAHQWLGFALGLTGRTEEALENLKVAQELDPFSASINTTAVWPLLWAHRGGEAIDGFRAAVEVHPEYWVAHLYLAMAYLMEGDSRSAVSCARQAAELGDAPYKLPGIGFVYARAGLEKETGEVLAKIEEVRRRHPVAAAFYCAAVQAGLGQKREAIRLLERAVTGGHWHVSWLPVDMIWDDFRDDPDFQRLLSAVNAGQIAT